MEFLYEFDFHTCQTQTAPLPALGSGTTVLGHETS